VYPDLRKFSVQNLALEPKLKKWCPHPANAVKVFDLVSHAETYSNNRLDFELFEMIWQTWTGYGACARFGLVTVSIVTRRRPMSTLRSDRRRRGLPCSHGLAAELSKCLAGDEMALDVEGVVDGGMS
jgi:hypothetical protein